MLLVLTVGMDGSHYLWCRPLVTVCCHQASCQLPQDGNRTNAIWLQSDRYVAVVNNCILCSAPCMCAEPKIKTDKKRGLMVSSPLWSNACARLDFQFKSEKAFSLRVTVSWVWLCLTYSISSSYNYCKQVTPRGQFAPSRTVCTFTELNFAHTCFLMAVTLLDCFNQRVNHWLVSVSHFHHHLCQQAVRYDNVALHSIHCRQMSCT